MKDRITIEGRDGAFGAYIARPKTLPAPAVVVLHEVFGVNADIRAAAALANGRTSEFLNQQLR
jgi:dienelactone hydrolase